MAISISLIALLLTTTIFSITTTAYGQGQMTSSTSGKSLDVSIEPTWSDGGQATFKVSFLKPGTSSIQQHIDYNFVIMKDGQQIFSATPQGQALLHTAEGVVTIPTAPFKFPNNGPYSVQVSVSGINFTPINTETATFPITVAPEFPTGALVAMAVVVMTTTTVLAQRRRIF
jgi:hypothetical protein